jgi:hypothetical protein
MVVVARDIPGLKSADLGTPISEVQPKKLTIIWSKFYDDESNPKLMVVRLSLDF